MAGISSAISIADRMSAPLKAMNSALNVLIGSMKTADTASSRMFDQADLGSAESSIDSIADSYEQMEATVNSCSNAQEQFNRNISDGDSQASKLHSTLSKVMSVAGIVAAVKWGMDFAGDTIDAANAQLKVETQLASVMKTMGNDAEDYQKVLAKAAELQGSTVYGDEAYIAGAAELSTYLSDSEAVLSMMDTLATYATGMTGGEALDTTGMTDMATQLGKVLIGAYDGITKKGFELTEQQKEIIENGTDMEKALVVSEVINESWDGLAENMANTPTGKVMQLGNAWGDVKEVIGNELYPAVMKLSQSFMDNIGLIGGVLRVIGYIFSGVLDLINSVITKVSEASNFTEENVVQVADSIGALFSFIVTVIDAVIDVVIPFVNFIVNVFNDPVQAIAYLFIDLADVILNILEVIASQIDKVFGSDLASGIHGWRNRLSAWAEEKLGERAFAIEPYELTESVQKGYEFGVGLVDHLMSDPEKAYDASSIFGDMQVSLDNIDENTSGLGSESELIEYLRDIAERDAINRFTTAEVRVELGGVTNNVRSGADLDEVVELLSDKLTEELSTTAAEFNGDM